MNVLALCAGVGGLELGVKLAVPTATVVCYVEREAYAASVLVQRMEDGLDKAPVWSDVATFDGSPWRGVVDCTVAGFPCQPHSAAGSRRGVEDDRWTWPEIARVVREVEPGIIFLENVPPLLTSGGFERVAGDLAALGFDAEWDVFSAAQCGAPHLRERIFILAAHTNARLERPRADARGTEIAKSWNGCLSDDADANSGRCKEVGVEDERDEQRASRHIADGCDDSNCWDRPRPEPAVRRMDDGMAHRVDRLRATGNGVVPQQAAAAWRHLSGRMTQ